MLRGAARELSAALGGVVLGLLAATHIPPATPPAPTLPSPDGILLGEPPSLAHTRASANAISSYDSATRTPRWVAEHLTAAALDDATSPAPGADSRVGVSFREDPALPPPLRAHLSAYSASGLDRGHLAPAADHVRGDSQSLKDSFLLTNVAPQAPGLNRGLWAALEAWVRSLTRAHAHVWVITGPLFLPQLTVGGGGGGGASRRWSYSHAAIGAPFEHIAVPTHFYKVVYACESSDGSGPAVVGAFVARNTDEEGGTLVAHAVPLAALEAAAGLRFWRGVATDEEKAAADAELGSVVGGGGALVRRASALLLGGGGVEGAALPGAAALASPSKRKPVGAAPPSPQRLRHVCGGGADACALPGEGAAAGRKKGAGRGKGLRPVGRE